MKNTTVKLLLLLVALVSADIAVRFIPGGAANGNRRAAPLGIDAGSVEELVLKKRGLPSVILRSGDAAAAGLLEALSSMGPEFLLTAENLEEFGLAGDEPLSVEIRMRKGPSRILRFGKQLPLDVMFVYFSENRERKVFKVLRSYPARIEKFFAAGGKPPL